MDLGTVQGALLFLILLLPGGIGYALMRSVTVLPEPKSDVARLFGSVVWSVTALAAVETFYSLVSHQPFGSYLIEPIATTASSRRIVGGVAFHYLVFVVVAAVIPTVFRWLIQRPFIERLMRGRTMVEPTLHRLLRYAPRNLTIAGKPAPYARIRTEDGVIEGWVRWA